MSARSVPMVQEWWGADVVNAAPEDAPWARGRNTVTFGRMRAEMAWAHRMFQHHGIRSGSTVVAHGTPSFTQIWSVMALLALGAQVLLVPHRAEHRGMASAVAHGRPEFLVTFGGRRSGGRSFRDECEVMVRRLPDGVPATSDHCLVLVSAGRSGAPRLAGRTAESLLVELGRLTAVEGVPRSGDRVQMLAPWDRPFGLVAGVMHGTAAGACLQFASTPTRWRAVRQAAEADVVLGTPFDYALLASLTDPPPLHLRSAVNGDGPLTSEISARFTDVYRARIGQIYSTVETGSVTADPAGRCDTPSVGTPLPGVRTRIEDGLLEIHLARSSHPRAPVPGRGGWLSTADPAALDTMTGAVRLLDQPGPQPRSLGHPHRLRGDLAPAGVQSGREHPCTCTGRINH